jgi:hypothetical protein
MMATSTSSTGLAHERNRPVLRWAQQRPAGPDRRRTLFLTVVVSSAAEDVRLSFDAERRTLRILPDVLPDGLALFAPLCEDTPDDVGPWSTRRPGEVTFRLQTDGADPWSRLTQVKHIDAPALVLRDWDRWVADDDDEDGEADEGGYGPPLQFSPSGGDDEEDLGGGFDGGFPFGENGEEEEEEEDGDEEEEEDGDEEEEECLCKEVEDDLLIL